MTSGSVVFFVPRFPVAVLVWLLVATCRYVVFFACCVPVAILLRLLVPVSGAGTAMELKACEPLIVNAPWVGPLMIPGVTDPSAQLIVAA